MTTQELIEAAKNTNITRLMVLQQEIRYLFHSLNACEDWRDKDDIENQIERVQNEVDKIQNLDQT